MDRFSHILIFTGDLPAMQRFYETLGLTARVQSPYYAEFDTGGATLGVRATPDPGQRGVRLQFATDDLEARVGELADRDVACEPIADNPWGRTTSCADPEGNRLGLWEPAQRFEAGSGLALSAVINCRDMAGMKVFYRDRLGFATPMDSAWWVQLSAGVAGLGLHPRSEGTHHACPITIGLAVPDLRGWHEEAVARGVAFTAPPNDGGFGTFADAMDPDGNPVMLRDVPEMPESGETLEERLAESYEDDAAPRRAAIRKPIRKRAKATSRVATRPQYRTAKPAKKRRRVTKSVARVVSPRGTGPAGTRMKPKRKRDPKRARTKPATGRRQKAERRTFKSQKQAIAGASRRKPVKRASRARTAKRVVARGRNAKR